MKSKIFIGHSIEHQARTLVRCLYLSEIRVFIAASRVLDKRAERIPQRYIDAAWLLGLLETELDCDPPYVRAVPTQKYLDLQEKYYGTLASCGHFSFDPRVSPEDSAGEYTYCEKCFEKELEHCREIDDNLWSSYERSFER